MAPGGTAASEAADSLRVEQQLQKQQREELQPQQLQKARLRKKTRHRGNAPLSLDGPSQIILTPRDQLPHRGWKDPHHSLSHARGDAPGVARVTWNRIG